MKMFSKRYNFHKFCRLRIMQVYCSLTPIFFTGLAFAQDNRVDSKKLYEQGEAAHNAGNYKLALDYFNKCLKESPGFADAYFTRGATREQLRDLNGANTDYNIYLELKPDQPEALLCRATVRYQLGLYEQAKADFLKLLTVPVGETETIFFNQSASATSGNQIITAQGSIKPQILNYLGLVETKLGHYKEAITWLDSAIALRQKEADYYVNRGIAKEGMNDTTSAMQDYNRAIELRPDHTVALHNIAVLKRKTGLATDSDLEKAIESDSSMLYPYLERGYQRMEGGYYKGALEDYDRALEIEGKDPEIWLNRGHVKEKLNDLKGAYADYTKAIELDEKFDKAWLNRGNVLSKQGRIEDAIQDYTIAITFNPDYAAAFYNRAIARQKLKQITEACEDLQKAESLGLVVTEKVKKEICK
ncbi:MAG TPA: tetratricopeptide repeat protein [Chryseolinea sp.]|nr:tetratricopeptide repeat protein [Chryseolinea sp.]